MDTLLKLSDDNPFREVITRMTERSKTRTVQGTLVHRKVTITLEEDYINIPFAKLFKNKEILGDLSPEACKVLVYIALNIGYGEEKLQIRQEDSGLSRRTFPRAIFDLVSNQVIVKEKREWYWVNLTLLIVGKIHKRDNSKS